MIMIVPSWQKIVGAIIIAIVLAGSGYFVGRSAGKTECAEEHAKDVAAMMADQTAQIKEYNKELREQIRIARTAQEKAFRLEVELESIKGGINDEIDKRQPAASCAPSDREWRLYQEAARKTRN